jgi:hypothetical protein
MTRFKAARLLRASALALFAILAPACASTGGPGGGGSSNLITREQIMEVPDGTAQTVIQRLRPAWLRARGQSSLSNPEPAFARVFVDEMQYGDINSLAGISTTEIESIEYISATDATTRYGTGYVGGIIRVRTRGT